MKAGRLWASKFQLPPKTPNGCLENNVLHIHSQHPIPIHLCPIGSSLKSYQQRTPCFVKGSHFPNVCYKNVQKRNFVGAMRFLFTENFRAQVLSNITKAKDVRESAWKTAWLFSYIFMIFPDDIS